MKKTLLLLLLSLFSAGVFAGESLITRKAAAESSRPATALCVTTDAEDYLPDRLDGFTRLPLPFLRGNETKDFLSRIARQQSTFSSGCGAPMKAVGLCKAAVAVRQKRATFAEGVAKHRRVRIAAHTGWV